MTAATTPEQPRTAADMVKHHSSCSACNCSDATAIVWGRCICEPVASPGLPHERGCPVGVREAEAQARPAVTSEHCPCGNHYADVCPCEEHDHP